LFIWLVVWNIFYFPHILGIIIPTDFHIFHRGWSHQRVYDVCFQPYEWDDDLQWRINFSMGVDRVGTTTNDPWDMLRCFLWSWGFSIARFVSWRVSTFGTKPVYLQADYTGAQTQRHQETDLAGDIPIWLANSRKDNFPNFNYHHHHVWQNSDDLGTQTQR
jgi:hypothetical protein